ncbi:MAG: Na(+)/H(+) antiporter subunit D [Pseudomonadota bacterium]
MSEVFSALGLSELNPGVIIIVAALLIPFLSGAVRSIYMLAIPVVAFAHLSGLPTGDFGQFNLFDMTLTTLRVDKLSVLFGTVFLIATFLGVMYALHVGAWLQQVCGLIYAGSAIGAVFAGDFVTLFVFWEMTAVSSVFLIWAANTPSAQKAGLQYLIIQIGSGVILLAGVLFYFRETGSIAFNALDVGAFSGQLILVAFGIKCAFPLVHTWLKASYPEATVTGAVMLSAFTTKLAVYALARGYAGTELLIVIGTVMTLFPILYAIIENDLRRVLAYALIGQLGIMVIGIGIGSDLAVNGAVAHAGAGIFYFAILFMAIGAVLYRTGTAKASELGGLYRSMPFTTAFAVLGALSIAAAPLFAGFVSKSLVLSAAGKDGFFWPWLAILFASGMVVVHTAAKLPYFAFFGRDSGKRCEEAPLNMLVAMGLAAVLCIGIGLYPAPLYALLPNDVSYEPYTVDHVVTQLQLLTFAALAFTLMLRNGLYPLMLKSVNLDTDWFYRRPGHTLAQFANRFRVYTWSFVADAAVGGATRAYQWMHRHAGPDGIFGRTWPTGTMAFWTTVMLGAVVIAGFMKAATGG